LTQKQYKECVVKNVYSCAALSTRHNYFCQNITKNPAMVILFFTQITQTEIFTTIQPSSLLPKPNEVVSGRQEVYFENTFGM